MSLSFVKSAVLSSTDGISHNEETTINNSETASVRNNPSSSGTHKPLFEQLRANQEAQQSKDDEFQRSLRGMRALDEEDVAHLDAMEEQRREVECRVKSGIEREVALFHAAREDRGLAQTVVETNDDDIDDSKDDTNKLNSNEGEVKSVAAVAKKQIVPKFTIKKKRKRVDNNSQSKDDNNIVSKKANDTAESKKSNDDADVNNSDEAKKTEATDAEKDEETKSNSVADLLGLGCYGSDSDSD